MKKLFLTLALSIASQAYGADWMLLDGDIDIDMESVQKQYIKNKPYVGVWTRLNDKYGVQATNLRWYSCKEKTMSELPSVSMEFDIYGNAINQNYRELNKLKFIKISSGTLSETVYDIICTASLMKDVASDENLTNKDMDRLRKEYRQEQFNNFRDFVLDYYGDRE